LTRPNVRVSFECFPPNTAKGIAPLRSTVSALEPLKPEFVSVTYGAGGTTQDRTIDTLNDLKENTGVPLGGHLTCVGRSKAEVHAVVDQYEDMGVSHIVALRGDPPEGTPNAGRHPEGYADAAELVAGIRESSNVAISVAAYPEPHPKAVSAKADLDNLKRKLDAGADQALTQFFFDNDVFMRFLDQAAAAGITQPIIPGIMPINNFGGIQRFAHRAGTTIPAHYHDLLEGLDETPTIRQLVAATIAAEQCQDLLNRGVTSFHLYTMNKPELSTAVCRMLGLRPDP
jgi:methylenetetrahydrofolate reductase (NADPH)